MGLSDRLSRLERRLPDPEQRVVIFTVIHDADPPEWAEEAIRSYLPTNGVAFVEWSRAPRAGGLIAKVDPQWYEVTPDGCRPIEAPFTLALDNPNGAGL